MEKKGGASYLLKGDLTIKGVTDEISPDAEYGGVATDPWGNAKAGFSLSGKIKRKNRGLNRNASLESGGVLVSEKVKLMAEVQFVAEG